MAAAWQGESFVQFNGYCQCLAAWVVCDVFHHSDAHAVGYHDVGFVESAYVFHFYIVDVVGAE